MPDSPTRHLWLVNNDLPAEVADEYNRWYLATHIPQLLALPGFVSGERLELAETQNGNRPVEMRHYLSVFEIEGDPAEAFAALKAAQGDGRVEKAPVQGSVAAAANFASMGRLVANPA
ncbi:MAG: hypothetical protein L0I76_00745 [Pseudonocardia sp.]|nr:hypothetical protein [Pseudonocardia sp.]